MSGFGEKFVHAIRRGSFCALIVIVAMPLLVAARAGQQSFELKLGIITSAAFNDALLGARMSLTEAQRAAQLLGGAVSATELVVTPSTTSDDVAEWLHKHEINATVVATDSTTLSAIAPALTARAIPVLSVHARAGGSREFELLPDCEVWKATLDPFGAAQLNARYQVANRAAMTSQAWAGWFAVKALWESASRLRTADPDRVSEFLGSSRAQFDGHRGQLLSFDAQSRTLRVPCL